MIGLITMRRGAGTCPRARAPESHHGAPHRARDRPKLVGNFWRANLGNFSRVPKAQAEVERLMKAMYDALYLIDRPGF